MDLGVTFDQRLCFNSHTEIVVCKTFKMLGFIKRISSEFKMSSSFKAFCIVHLCVLRLYCKNFFLLHK